ncbi:hypothetical protein HMPREF1306_04914 [Klebsiella pneumoniae subsp. pneumoniae WGLW2]|nr:hypothetical protein HMPREF1306_04914 [Klebsiella pneumoniae subsp. pneumoniae WGLW2]OUG79501.1 hypothetical protein AZZ97_004920 [Klebsiella pneumoniae]
MQSICSKLRSVRTREHGRMGISCNTMARYLTAKDVPSFKQLDPQPSKFEVFETYVI